MPIEAETETVCGIEVEKCKIKPKIIPSKCITCRFYEPPAGCKKPATNPITK